MKQIKYKRNPELLIAVLALMISLMTFCWTTLNQKVQNNRWEEMNVGKVDYVESKVIMWGEFTQEEVLDKDWGHQPLLYSEIENELHTNKYRIPYSLILFDSSERSIVPNTGFGYTTKEMENRFIKYNIDKTSVEIRKNFQCKFVFLNTGNTPTENVKIKISCGTERNDYKVVLHDTSDPIKMFPGKKVMIQTNFFIPLQVPIPDNLYYQIEVKYDNFLAKGLTDEWSVVYYSSDGTWKFGA